MEIFPATRTVTLRFQMNESNHQRRVVTPEEKQNLQYNAEYKILSFTQR